MIRQVRAESVGVQRVSSCDGRAQGAPVPDVHHCCFFHAGQRHQGVLHLCALDAVSQDLHLRVDAPQEHDQRARRPGAAIPRAIPAFTVDLDETFFGEGRIVEVAGSQARAADPEFPGDVIGAVASHGIRHAVPLPGQGQAIRCRAPLRKQVLLVRHELVGPDRGLGGTPHHDHPRSGEHSMELSYQIGAHPVSGAHENPRSTCVAARCITGSGYAEHLGQARNRVPQRDTVSFHQIEPGEGVAALRLAERDHSPAR